MEGLTYIFMSYVAGVPWGAILLVVLTAILTFLAIAYLFGRSRIGPLR